MATAKIRDRALLLLRAQYQQVKIAQTEYNNSVGFVAAAMGIDPDAINEVRLEQGEIDYTGTSNG